MSLVELVFYIALVGFLVWVVLQIPMAAPFKNLIIGVVIFAVVFWLLQSFGLLHGFAPMRLR